MARIIPNPGLKPADRPAAAAAAAAPSAPPPAAPAAPSGGRRLLWPAVCVAQLGLFAGLLVGMFFGGWFDALRDHLAGAGGQHGAPDDKKDDEGQPGLKPGETPNVERGDELMREGRYDLALKVYEPLSGGASGALRDVLQYRVALCQEGLGRNDAALKGYRAVSGQTASPRTAAAADIGQARVLVRQRKPVEARNLLYALLLRSGAPEVKDQPFLGDARYLLALTLTVEALRAERPGPLNEALAEYTANDWPVESAVDWVPAEKEPAKEKEGEAEKSEKGGKYSVRHTGKGPQQTWVSAAVPKEKLTKLVEHLATESGLKVRWTDSARRALADRSTEVFFEELPLTDVLLALTDPLGVEWAVKDETLRLTAEADAAASDVLAYRAATAKRALDSAVASNPGHRMTAAAYLELGNMEARDGNLDEAVKFYLRLKGEFGRSPLVAEASYNRGMVRLKQGKTDDARQAFWDAADHMPAHELAPLSRLQIGRALLLDGDAAGAVKPLTEAVAASAGTATQPAAAVTLSAAYLLTKEPRKARDTVRLYREGVGREPFRATALFVEAYGDYLATAQGQVSSQEASDLLAALWGVQQKEPVLGAVGTLLIGKAYGDLGLHDEMIAVYEKALPRLKGAVAAEMSFAVAEDLYRRDKRDAARRMYAALVKPETPRWSAPAQLRLAEIALRDNRPLDGLKWCRKLLEDKSVEDRTAVLSLMGQAYEMTHDYRQAARCFEGKLPE